tara:strand:- start:32 stop:349 length:318 start_codon:yes stop_codon:yes gene_type:complete
MVKQDDMVKVLVKEILELNQEILFEQQDNMKKVSSINSPYKNPTVHQLLDNDEIIKSVEESMSALEPIKHRLKVFNKIFEIILEEGEENDTPTSKSNRGKDITVV